MDSIVPLVKKYLRLYLKPVGSEDFTELQQDCLATAAAMLDSAERRGVPINARSIVYYSIQSMRSGIRSYSRASADVMGPIARMKRLVKLQNIDAKYSDFGSEDDEQCLKDLIVDPGDDPCIQTSKRLDWDAFLNEASDQDRDLLLGTAAEVPVKAIAWSLKMSPPAVVFRKRLMGKRLAAAWNTDPQSVIADSISAPAWKKHVRASAEGRASRFTRLEAERNAVEAEGKRQATGLRVKKATGKRTKAITVTGGTDELARAA